MEPSAPTQPFSPSALQAAADHAIVRRSVRVTGIAATIFGVLALFAAIVPPAEPVLLVVGGALTVVGLWNATNPHPIGIATGAVCLIIVGFYNVISGFLAAAVGQHPFVGWQVLGVWQVIWGFQGFARYRRFAAAFQAEPQEAERLRAAQMITALRRARPKREPDVIEFTAGGLQPKRMRARLMPEGVLCLIAGGDDVRIVTRQAFELTPTGKVRFGGASKIRAKVGDLSQAATISAEGLARYRAWKPEPASTQLAAA